MNCNWLKNLDPNENVISEGDDQANDEARQMPMDHAKMKTEYFN